MTKVAALLWLVIATIPTMASGQTSSGLAAPLWAVAPGMPKERQEDLARQHQAIIRARWDVCIDLQMVTLEEARALELLPQLQSVDQREVDAAWERLQGMLRKGEATLVAWPIIRTMDGARGVSETVLEKRYPTEFEPPQEPQTFGPGSPKPGKIRADTVEGLPNAYETRNLGVTLIASPLVLREGRLLFLDLDISRVDLLGFEDFGYALTVHNTLVPAPAPRFTSLRSTLKLKLQSSQRQLVAVHKLVEPKGVIEFHLIRAVVCPVD
jgi:hypothetical protein